MENSKLIGTLTKTFGYNGFQLIEIGTKVFEINDRYCFEMNHLNSNKKSIQKFYKEDLKAHIKFRDCNFDNPTEIMDKNSIEIFEDNICYCYGVNYKVFLNKELEYYLLPISGVKYDRLFDKQSLELKSFNNQIEVVC